MKTFLIFERSFLFGDLRLERENTTDIKKITMSATWLFWDLSTRIPKYKLSTFSSLELNRQTLDFESNALPLGYWILENYAKEKAKKNKVTDSENGKNHMQRGAVTYWIKSK